MMRFFILIAIVSVCLGCNRLRQETPMHESDQPRAEAMIAALREAYAAFNRGDIESAVSPMAADIEWSEPPEFPGGRTYHGVKEVKGYLTQSRSGWAEGASQPERFIVAGDRIVVFVHARFRLQGSNDWRDVSLADVYTVRNGKAVQMRAFAERQTAMRWAGVGDSAR